jgi:class 3 adenylate cyclase
LHAAVDLQRTFTGSSLAGDSEQLAVRVGVHSGFVISNPDQLLGRNVVLASRIAAQAKGGEILVSSTLKQYTENDPSFTFEQHGEYHFKGLLGEHVIYRVLWR